MDKPLLKAWKNSGTSPNAEFKFQLAYCEALRSLAAHNAQRAIDLATEANKTVPETSDERGSVILAAAGLMGLLYELGSHAESVAKFSKLPEPAQIYYAVYSFILDESNGGISQALGNSTGNYHPLVTKGYKEIGATASLSVLEWMCKPFGPNGPARDRAERIAQMEAMTPSYWEQEESLYESWSTSSISAQDGGTLWLLSLYAARHADVLRPLIESIKDEREKTLE